MTYQYITTSAPGAEYRKTRVEFSSAAATQAWAWLASNNPQFTSTITRPDTGARVKINQSNPFWARVKAAIATLRPDHCDASGQWYSDADVLPYEQGEALMALYTEIMARLAGSVATPYSCAGASDGCPAKVATSGMYCPRCQRDA